MTDTNDARPICDYEGSAYRTDFWENQGREYEDGAERVAIRRLLPPTGQRLLDIGAGFGRLATLYDGYREVVLLDYSRSQLEYARSRLGDERFIYVAADIYRLPLATDSIDATVMVRVLHHLSDVSLAFQHIQRVLRPNGAFVLEFANKRHLKNIARHLLRRGVDPFDPQPYEFAELHYDFHPTWVLQRLAEAGLATDKRLAVSSLRSGALKRIFSAATLVKIDSMLQEITAPLAVSPSVFVRSRAIKAGRSELPERTQLFRCPACGHEPLDPNPDGLCCAACRAQWPLENGVYVFK